MSRLRLIIFLIGAIAVTAQTLLVRELLNLLAGNELIYGLTIFLWLIGYAAGSGLLGKFSDKVRDPSLWLNSLVPAVALLLPAEIFLTRTIRLLAGVPTGVQFSPWAILLISSLVLWPITLLLGLLFSLAGKITKDISRVYIYETLGSLCAGCLFTFILVYYFDPFRIAALLIILAALLLRPVRTNWPWGIAVSLSIIFFFCAPFIDQLSNRLNWQGFTVSKTADSPYGRLTVIKDGDSSAFFENGQLLFSTADVLAAEETAHLALLPRSNPKYILLIGGGPGGVLRELLKYPVEKIDYVEQDYKLIELAGALVPSDQRVKVHLQDGADFLNRARTAYDVILIDLPAPTSANLNRFFTLEFFQQCRRRLAPRGLVVFHLDTAESYLGRELKLVNRSLYKTFTQVFPCVTVIPGNYNYYFGSENKIEINAERWPARQIATKYFRSDTIKYVLWPAKLDYVRKAVSFEAATPVNRQLAPITYYLSLLLWTSYYSDGLKDILYKTAAWSAADILFGLIFIAALLKLLSWRWPKLKLPLVIMLLGFCGLCAQLIIIYTFQALYGYIYQTIGLLTALFMAGLATGSYLIVRIPPKDPARTIRLAIWAFLALLIILLIGLRLCPLPLASFLIALPIGMVFPLAVSLRSAEGISAGHLAGSLYGADLAGGALGAIITTIFILPIFGVLGAFGAGLILAAAALLIAYS